MSSSDDIATEEDYKTKIIEPFRGYLIEGSKIDIRLKAIYNTMNENK